ncbi:MAG: hypothetical protein V4644_01760 [Patescibacteria group bacterium]
MNFPPDIHLYESEDGSSVYDDLIAKLGKATIKVQKKLSMYAQMHVLTLIRTEVLDPIKGNKDGLYELKVRSLPIPVRFICALEGQILILLSVFFTSGSGTQVRRHVPHALNRLVEWRSRKR